MPVLKTTEYPWTDGSFRPLCHARCAAVQGTGVYFELTFFEREPSLCGEVLNGSCAAVSFDFFPGGEKLLTVAVAPNGRHAAFLNGAPYAPPALEPQLFAGDDEQGWYHGVRFYIKNDVLWSLYGRAEFSPGHILQGNIYKFKRAGSDSHLGAVAPLREDSIFSRANLADFIVVR